MATIENGVARVEINFTVLNHDPGGEREGTYSRSRCHLLHVFRCDVSLPPALSVLLPLQTDRPGEHGRGSSEARDRASRARGWLRRRTSPFPREARAWRRCKLPRWSPWSASHDGSDIAHRPSAAPTDTAALSNGLAIQTGRVVSERRCRFSLRHVGYV